MSTLRTIEQDIENLTYIGTVVETYESVAATCMRRTKKSIMESRAFYDGLRNAYDDVSYSYQQELAVIKEKHFLFPLAFWKTLATRIRRQREVAVWLSANTSLYGDIVQKTFNMFLKHITSTKTDIIIVGKRGKLLFDERMPRVRYTYQDMPDTLTDTEHFASLVELCSRHKRIRVFYGKFESFVSQTPSSAVLDESQQTSAANALEPPRIKPVSQYLFEPSLKEVAHFFETEITASLFQQITEESRLAKLAARMYQLDAATGRLLDILSGAVLERQKLLHQLANKRQLELVSSRIAIGI